MFKVSNETKVGALTVIAVTLLILGYNMLKGKNLINRSDVIYVRMNDAGPLEVSNPVKIKGYKIGNIYSIGSKDENVSELIVAINLNKKVNIPVNSVASVAGSLTQSASLIIALGDAKTYAKEGDTLNSVAAPDLLTKLGNNIDPVLANVKMAIDSLKLVLGNLNDVFDEGNKANLKAVTLIRTTKISIKPLKTLKTHPKNFLNWN